ncbi:ABC transporter permease [Halovenus salina]|uniref:ABC transporter permease n=1 Tax=Halovenus salina TaxID=1510225 RepID=UPI002260C85F|nr:ABC transporter permease [Halovenus salina]
MSKEHERFDEVDWSEINDQTSRLSLSINTKLLFVSLAPIVGLFLYDFFRVGEFESTFEKLGSDLGLSSMFESLGMDWDPGSIDYLFFVTLLLFVWYMVFPLYQNPRMTKYYWTEFKRNRPAMVSLIWLGIVFIGGTVGPFFVNKPKQDILYGYQPPVFSEVSMLNINNCKGDVVDGMCQGTWEHALGSTKGGKDVFAIIVHGTTVSIKIAFITTLLVALIGVSIGTVSAYAGGWVDEILMRFTDIVLSFPTLIFLILLTYIFGTSLGVFLLIFAVFSWGGLARYSRSKALSVTEEEFVKATRISGASKYRVVRRHIVPNTASSIITDLTLAIPGFLLAEAQLSFLDLGPSATSWGGLIDSGFSSLSYAPWITLSGGLVLFITILAFNFVGDALLDALNPEAEAESESEQTGGQL